MRTMSKKMFGDDNLQVAGVVAEDLKFIAGGKEKIRLEIDSIKELLISGEEELEKALEILTDG